MGTVINFGRLQGTTGVLAEQELRAALAVCAGMANKEIARVIGCAPGTAKKSIERVFYKLRVSNRAALICEAFRRGLISFASAASPSPQGHEDQNQNTGVFVA
ncbi:LuxR C-terminal-related transcriptional regulator [Pseudomonas sp. ArH3a]|uniref:response regulator transcription factor n=1 Tax=Pseudomonas sp. ArH3a TaxID=2862945 RepID=UPI001F570A81|nr:LuxR C-terminal-related transcriptional regulator [Pseudomonas sp. ArH3a]UNM18071.1 LuxR C-terminal-related transcriptional regulator [Pseudomonas sp. ArH3a]